MIRVGRSRLAPHRVKQTRICPVRSADRSEEMTMRRIQDMTLNVSRGLERLDKRLSERSERFKKEFDRLVPFLNSPAFGIRLTAAPVVDEIGFDRVFQQGSIVKDLDMPWRTVTQKGRDDELRIPPEFSPRFSALLWRPLLRGARVEPLTNPGEGRLSLGYREIHCDGLVELGLASIADVTSPLLCDPDWPIVMFANLAAWADHIRKPTVEYVLVAETCYQGDEVRVGKAEAYHRSKRGGMPLLKFPNEKFPRYPLKDSGEITELLTLFYRDFWHSMSKDKDADFVLG